MNFKPHHVDIQTYDMHHIVWLKIEIWTFCETINFVGFNTGSGLCYWRY